METLELSHFLKLLKLWINFDIRKLVVNFVNAFNHNKMSLHVLKKRDVKKALVQIKALN